MFFGTQWHKADRGKGGCESNDMRIGGGQLLVQKIVKYLRYGPLVKLIQKLNVCGNKRGGGAPRDISKTKVSQIKDRTNHSLQIINK